MLKYLSSAFIYLLLRYLRPFLKRETAECANVKTTKTQKIISTAKNDSFKSVAILLLVFLTLSLFLSSVVTLLDNSIVYALLSSRDGGKGSGFAAPSPPSGFQRSNNGGIGNNNLGAFSGIERSPSHSLNNGPSSGTLTNLHPSANNPPLALGGLQQQQHQPLLNAAPSNANHVVNPNGCSAVVHPNGADTKIVQPSNCSPPGNPSATATTVVRAPANNTPIDTRVIHTNDNSCAAVVHPNGVDTKAVHSDNCPTSTNGHITVNPSSTTSSSSSSLTINNVQGSNTGSTTSSRSSSNMNTIPIANAGSNQKVHPSDHVILDGTKSSNPSGGSLKFSWLQLAGGQIISLSNQDNAKTTFIAPSVTGTTILTFQLIVNNGNAYSAPSYVTVTVQP
jgi:hypothetical protein